MLQYLDVAYNYTGSDGAKCISAVLPQCHALHTLAVDAANVDESTVLSLLAATKQCPALEHLYFRACTDPTLEIINRVEFPEELRFHQWANSLQSLLLTLMLAMRRRPKARPYPRLPSEIYHLILTEFLTDRDFLRREVIFYYSP